MIPQIITSLHTSSFIDIISSFFIFYEFIVSLTRRTPVHRAYTALSLRNSLIVLSVHAFRGRRFFEPSGVHCPSTHSHTRDKGITDERDEYDFFFFLIGNERCDSQCRLSPTISTLSRATASVVASTPLRLSLIHVRTC